ncbi:uncharacterized protein BJ171DRAFT_506679 [Polychytrium aggregatum]|uniref:uncharacterized protein n=1 Tax=Polychytrium aggregatum TaxID=110093 RepID=UPI0022FDDC6F|nr:uncharacterized protein BJ171DRAFT_506673 [Polychytrium aggregatum]XP_052966320.1 uncharacterized protein BJ171DRAFT_506679 [Polychytrium aggregatum]KAI9204237.1 hypothetical protein BJ171DRAFT_506673 [Polychytrium aggregatum]KAI9204240.1 hypothetical protein BJ171DRAFT_506679 [Polychytrium aggregatum]
MLAGFSTSTLLILAATTALAGASTCTPDIAMSRISLPLQDNASVMITPSVDNSNFTVVAMPFNSSASTHPGMPPVANYWFFSQGCRDLSMYDTFQSDVIIDPGVDFTIVFTQNSVDCKYPQGVSASAESQYHSLYDFLVPSGQRQTLVIPLSAFSTNWLNGSFDFQHTAGMTFINQAVGSHVTMISPTLKGKCTNDTPTPSLAPGPGPGPAPQPSSGPNIPAIVGGVVGALVVAFVAALYVIHRRREAGKNAAERERLAVARSPSPSRDATDGRRDRNGGFDEGRPNVASTDSILSSGIGAATIQSTTLSTTTATTATTLALSAPDLAAASGTYVGTALDTGLAPPSYDSIVDFSQPAPVSSSRVSTPTQKQYLVVSSHKSLDDSELSVGVKEIVVVLASIDNNWALAEALGGRRGRLPWSCVQEMDTADLV